MKQPIQIFLIFFFSAIGITVLHFLYHPIRVLGMDISIFYMDERTTLAAFFTTLTSFVTGYISLIQITTIKKKFDKILFGVFGAFFILLSFDEYFELHEYANTLVKQTLKQGSQFQQLAQMSWIFPLSIFIFVVFLVFILLFTRHKELSFRIPVALGIAAYVVVLILEVAGGQTYGDDIYITFVGFEEGLEMVGGSLFLLAAFNFQQGKKK